uniref:VanZ family protein n=1 Tax=Promineifilum sp. TaxID=2664178 RepID=UPI0035ADCC05
MCVPKQTGRRFIVLCLAGLALILYTRLTPFDFTWAGHIPFERITWQPLTIRDVPLNVLLWLPFSFGLAGVLSSVPSPVAAPPLTPPEGRGIGVPSPRGRGLGRGSAVLLISILLSIALEATQLFLPDRVPSVADVAANAAGAALGLGLYRAWEMGWRRALKRVTPLRLLAGLALYTLGAALLTGYLNRSVRLSNWDTSFPLVVGNEAVGKRQWSGRVDSVALAAGLADSPDFVARFDFHGAAPFADAGGSSVPPLVWDEGPTTLQDGGGVNVGPGEWLTTGVAFAGFSEAGRAFNAFAIQTMVASADPAQRGPARIVSISADAERRNVTIGQEEDALIIRLRTPAGGENGQKPELLVP